VHFAGAGDLSKWRSRFLATEFRAARSAQTAIPGIVQKWDQGGDFDLKSLCTCFRLSTAEAGVVKVAIRPVHHFLRRRERGRWEMRAGAIIPSCLANFYNFSWKTGRHVLKTA
jgi:hypothetical protein